MFAGTPCGLCLVASRVACGLQDNKTTSDALQRHAIALRVWLWARAQRSLAAGLVSERGSWAILEVHIQRSLHRFFELALRKELETTYLGENARARGVTLSTAAAFIAPLGVDEYGSLDSDDIGVHAKEVMGSLSKAVEADLDGMFGVLADTYSGAQHTAVEEGALACADGLQLKGGAAVLAAATAADAAKGGRRPTTDAHSAAGSGDDDYIPRLCGTLRALELVGRGFAAAAAL